MSIDEQLKAIVPGKTYPRQVTVNEPDGHEVKFLLQSYYVGMYCAIHLDGGAIPHQVGDHNNTTFVRKLKKDLKVAIKRGATVEISGMANCQLEP
jgi:hypothetical protein